MPTTSEQSEEQLSPLAVNSVANGARQLVTAAMPTAAFGMAFGAAAAETGFGPVESTLISALVFAGAAQFAFLEFGQTASPLGAIILTTFAINARHIALGATLFQPLQRLRSGTRLLVLFFLSDANWAMAKQDPESDARAPAIILGGGMLLWGAWVLGTFLGSAGGNSLGNFHQFGLDVLMPAFFSCLLVGATKHLAELIRVLGAGSGALALALVLPAHWALIVAAVVPSLIRTK